MNRLIKQAFTLIELLVVIAIIGILSGLIVVSMGGMTDKANIARSQIFANSLRSSLLLDLVSEWKLNNITSATTADSWSGGNVGTVGGSPQLKTSECVSDKCFYLNGTTDYVVGTLNGFSSVKSWTISGWFKTNDSNAIIFDTRTSGNNGIFLYEDSLDYWRVYVRSASVVYKDYYYSLNLSNDDWHYAALTRDGNNALLLYIDGELKNPSALSINGDMSNVSETWSTFAFGVYHQLGAYFLQGYLDDIRLFKKGVSMSQIKEQYYAGLNSLLDSGSISNSDYQKRLLVIGKK